MSDVDDAVMQEFLVCYDYGTGGVWYRMRAPSAQSLREAFPDFVVFDEASSWWREGALKVRNYVLGATLDPTLQSLVDDARKNSIRPLSKE